MQQNVTIFSQFDLTGTSDKPIGIRSIENWDLHFKGSSWTEIGLHHLKKSLTSVDVHR